MADPDDKKGEGDGPRPLREFVSIEFLDLLIKRGAAKRFCDGRYLITNNGNVYSYYAKNSGKGGYERKHRPVRLRLNKDKNGYHLCHVYDSKGNKRAYRVHRLVCEFFIGKRGKSVNHKNGIKTDNSVGNLEYATTLENVRHAHSIGLVPVSKLRHLTDSQVERVRAIGRKHSALRGRNKFISARTGVPVYTVCRILNNKIYKMN